MSVTQRSQYFGTVQMALKIECISDAGMVCGH
jgi:hypothetical protein